jgi:hypothetical protein
VYTLTVDIYKVADIGDTAPQSSGRSYVDVGQDKVLKD